MSHWDVKAHIIARGCEMLTFIGGGEGYSLLQNGRRFLRRHGMIVKGNNGERIKERSGGSERGG